MNTLRIIELFSSIQGETTSQGCLTTFIRLAGCNLRCSWCDTPYSFGGGKPSSVEEILTFVQKQGCHEVCVTGGEPLLQPSVFGLISSLCQLGFSVQVETGGSLPTDKVDPRARVILDVKCPASQMAHKNLYDNLNKLRPHDEVKFVIANREDYCFSKEIIQRYDLFHRCKAVLLSPVFDELPSKQLVEWMLEDQLSQARLNLQLHKFIWSPSTQGV